MACCSEWRVTPRLPQARQWLKFPGTFKCRTKKQACRSENRHNRQVAALSPVLTGVAVRTGRAASGRQCLRSVAGSLEAGIRGRVASQSVKTGSRQYSGQGGRFSPRPAHDRQSLRVDIGAEARADRDIMVIVDGCRKGQQGGREMLRWRNPFTLNHKISATLEEDAGTFSAVRNPSGMDLSLVPECRGPENSPEPAIGDGALGLWNVFHRDRGVTREQHCWAHMTGVIFNRKSISRWPRSTAVCTTS